MINTVLRNRIYHTISFEIMKQEKLKMPIWIGIQEIVLLESAIRIRLRLLRKLDTHTSKELLN